MTSPVVTVTENDNLAHARNTMTKHCVGRLVVTIDGTVQGIITWTDLMRAFLSREKDWITLPIDQIFVKEVMTKNPIMIRRSKSIRLAAKTMTRHKISGLPAVDNEGELKGILTKTDVVRAIQRTRSAKLPVSSIMTRKVVTISGNHTLYRAAYLMNEYSISHLIITDGNLPVGIISKSDLASFAPLGPRFEQPRANRKISSHEAWLRKSLRLVPVAKDLMCADLLVIKPDATLSEASSVMLRRGISSLPVVDSSGTLNGIITKSDLVSAVAKFR